MIAPVTPIPSVSTTDTRTEAERQHARELLRSVMTEPFRRWLMKHALKWTHRDWDAAQELVQETFLVLLRCNAYNPAKAKPSTFAFAHMKWQFMKRKIALRAKPAAQRLKHDPKSGPQTMSPETLEVVRGVRAAIETLPQREYAVLTQRMSGLSLQELADQAGVSRQRIQQIEARAMSRMADMPLPI